MPLTWQESTMSTGVPQIDAQHQELIRRFNVFHEGLKKGEGKAQLAGILGFMGEYAESHFRGEEHLMAVQLCPAAGENRIAHAEFRRRVADLRRQIEEDGVTASAAIEVERALASWLKTHLCTIDVQLRDTAACRRKAG
jgi:hemerythrin